MKLIRVFVLGVAVLATQVWAINKCTGADGKVVYQDAACEGGRGQALNIRPASGQANSATANEAQARLDKLKGDNTMSEAIRTHKPLVGMTLAQLQDAMGSPTQVNANNYNGIQQDQVIFERPQETWLVYTRNGLVDSIQNRPGAPLGATPVRAAGRCPSQHEINNAITSASSMTLSEVERAERWKTIRAMQTCGK